MRLARTLDGVRTALDGVVAHPLRSSLSAASFACALATTAVLVAVGGGLHEAVEEILVTLGEGQVDADPGRTTGPGGQRRAGRRVRIRYDDVERLDALLSSFEGVAAYTDLRGAGAASARYSIPWSPVRGVSRSYRDVRRMPVVEGRWFTEEEEERGEWVAVLNSGLRRMVFHDEPAVGNWVEWRGRRMVVVGVVRDEALFPYILFVPYRAARQIGDARYISGLVARPRPEVRWDDAVAELRRVMAAIGGFDPNDMNALEIEDNREFTSRVATGMAALHILILTIAAVSMLLGGLGVANMMVISVTERIREIGLRKALGATPADIRWQFLVESWMVLLVGAAAGLAVGAVCCMLIGQVPLSTQYRATVRFDLVVALICLGALLVVGTLASGAPARRAASLEAAEALRWE